MHIQALYCTPWGTYNGKYIIHHTKIEDIYIYLQGSLHISVHCCAYNMHISYCTYYIIQYVGTISYTQDKYHNDYELL